VCCIIHAGIGTPSARPNPIDFDRRSSPPAIQAGLNSAEAGVCKCGFGSCVRKAVARARVPTVVLRKPHLAKSSGWAFIFPGIVTFSDSISPDTLRLNLCGRSDLG
jgi:hypothetical protein